MDNKINEIFENDNFSKKTNNKGNKSINYDTSAKTEDVAFAQSLLLPTKKKIRKSKEEAIEDAIVLSNEVTTIDLMMPEDEREIIEKNINLYSDMDKMVKVLSDAKKNKKISEEIKTLELISKTGNVSQTIIDLMMNEDNLRTLNEYIQRKFDEGDIAKAYKEIGMLSKIMLDARSEMIKSLAPKKNSRTGRIEMKFTNDSGEEFQLGVDM